MQPLLHSPSSPLGSFEAQLSIAAKPHNGLQYCEHRRRIGLTRRVETQLTANGTVQIMLLMLNVGDRREEAFGAEDRDLDGRRTMHCGNLQDH